MRACASATAIPPQAMPQRSCFCSPTRFRCLCQRTAASSGRNMAEGLSTSEITEFSQASQNIRRLRDAGIPSIGFWLSENGHVQAARADAQGFRDRRARCAEYPVDHRGNRSSEDARISRINSTEMLAPPANQIHGLCSRRADSRTVSEHNGDGDALHLVRWVQLRSTFGLRLWCTDGGFRYFRLS